VDKFSEKYSIAASITRGRLWGKWKSGSFGWEVNVTRGRVRSDENSESRSGLNSIAREFRRFQLGVLIYVRWAKGRRWETGRQGQGWSGSPPYHPEKAPDWSGCQTTHFLPKIGIWSGKNPTSADFWPNLVRIPDRTSPPIIGGPALPRSGLKNEIAEVCRFREVE